MKIACESCGTKYAIADDKVRGKVFKIRCKKCQSVIVVRGTEGEDGRTTPVSHEMSMTPPPQAEPFLAAELGAPIAGSAAFPAAAPAGGGAVWHLAIGNDQKGPFTAAEVKERSRRGEINGETFIWREGQADWKPLSDVPEFADVASQGRDRSAELFGRVDEGPTGGELKIGQGVVSSEMPVGLAAGGSMFGEADQAGAEEAPEMTGARHDTSVLFSLTNLTSMAGPGKAAPAAAKPSAPARTEGSGLIDIRKMAAGLPVHGGSAADDMAAIGAFSPTVAAPVLLPMMPSGPPKWLWPVVGLGGAIVLGMIVLIVILATKKDTVVVQAPPPAVPAVPGATAAPPATPSPETGAPAKPEAATAPATTAAGATQEPSRDRSPSKRSTSERGRTRREEPSSPSPAPAVAPTSKPAKKGGGDSLDELLSGATGGRDTSTKSGGGGPTSDPTEVLPENLSRQQIQTGMSGIRPRVQACNQQYRVPGTVNVDITISRAGRIQSASVSGRFAGTPTGSCVEKAVKAATFPKFSGAPISISYPFVMN